MTPTEEALEARRRYDRAKERLAEAQRRGSPGEEIARRRADVQACLQRLLQASGRVGAERARTVPRGPHRA